MPTTISDDKRALDLLAQGKVPEETKPKLMEKLGVSDDDIRAWSIVSEKQDERSAAIRNQIYEKVAQAQPIEDPENFTGLQAMRFLAKNFIDQDAKTQENFFKKLGYDAKADKFGNISVYDKERNRRISVDPKGIDLWDISDIFTDLLEGVGVSAAIGAGIVGGASAAAPLGAPLGPLGALTTAAAGGIAGGLLAAGGVGASAEAARQSVGLLTGAREEYDPGRMVEQAKIAALFAPLEMVGIGATKKGERVLKESATHQIEKETAQKIKDAAKVLGVEATPGMLKQSKEVQMLESSLLKSEGRLGGMKLRKTVENNKKQIQKVMSDFIEPKTPLTPFQSGEKFGENVVNELAEKLTPAIETYNKYDAMFKNTVLPKFGEIAVPGDKKLSWLEQKAAQDIVALKDRVKGDPKGNEIVNSVIKRIKNTNTINDITVLKQNIADEARRNRDEPIWQFINQNFGTKLREYRFDAIKDVAKDEKAAKELAQADAIYAATANQVENLIKAKKLKPGVRSALNDWLKTYPDIKRVEKIIDTKDPRRIAKAANDFPESFEYLRDAFKRNFYDKMQRTMRQEGLNVNALAKELDKLPPETVSVLYGENGSEIIEALKTYLKSLPEDVNPSKTSHHLSFLNRFSVMGYPIEQISSVWRELRLNQLSKKPSEKNFYDAMGKFISRLAKKTTPIVYPAVKGKEEETRAMRRPSFLPPSGSENLMFQTYPLLPRSK
jgi:hypothetical protein